jgi:predicted aspartyl protease
MDGNYKNWQNHQAIKNGRLAKAKEINCMTVMDNDSGSSNRKQFFATIHLGAFRPAIVLDVVTAFALTLFCSVPRYVYAASSQPTLGQNVEVRVLAAPDEFSELVETVGDGASLSPMGETTGPGGLNWFMVKTRNGNVGWVKADDNPAIRKIDGHFRSLRNEATVIESGSAPASTTSSKTSAGGAIVVPVKILAGHAIVPVTFNNSITANLMVDTGASRTMVSKRVARDLRLYSMGSGTGYGVGGRVTLGIGRVESIKVGEVEIQNMPVSIHDFSPDPSYEGLLGVDFLGRFHMSLDSAKQVMVLTPR